MVKNDNQQKNVSRELDERLLELTALFEITQTLTASLSLNAILENLLRIPMGHMLISRGIVLLQKEQDDEFIVEDLKGISHQLLNKSLVIDDPPSHAVLVKDIPKDCDWASFFKKFDIQLILPLNSSQGTIGVVGFGGKISGQSFKQGEIEFLNSLSNIAATAVSNGLMVEEIQGVNRKLDRKIQQLNTIFDISRELNTTLDRNKIVNLLSFAVMGELMVNKCVVATACNDHWEVSLSKGTSVTIPENAEFSQVTEPVFMEESASHEVFHSAGLSVLVPMRLHEVTHGVIMIGPKISDSDFDEADLEFLKTLGNQAVTAIENARLFEEALEKQRLEEELNLARHIQQDLLPSDLPLISGYDIAAVNIPSKQVGGDYFDVIPIREGVYGIAIADVSGKGAGAALLMANLQASLHALCSDEDTISDMVSKVNRLVCQNTSLDKYITFFYGELNVADHTFTYCNAGHNPPYKVTANGQVYDLTIGGIVLGMMPEMAYQTETIKMEPNDRIVMFTDGITESMDANEEEFGENRVKKIIQEDVNLSAQALLDRIVNEAKQFSAEYMENDDITLVVLRKLKKKNKTGRR